MALQFFCIDLQFFLDCERLADEQVTGTSLRAQNFLRVVQFFSQNCVAQFP